MKDLRFLMCSSLMLLWEQLDICPRTGQQIKQNMGFCSICFNLLQLFGWLFFCLLTVSVVHRLAIALRSSGLLI